MNQKRQMSEAIQVEDRRRGTTSIGATVDRRLLLGGEFVLRYSLVFFLLFFGALKWTAEEANGIQSWVEHSPLLFWLLRAFGVQGASEFIGVIELTIGTLIALRHWSPKLSAIGSMAAIPMFVTTLSFIITTPNVGEASGFLLKDLTLLGAAMWTAGEALHADRSRIVA